MSRSVAAVDCGTNSIRLLILQVEADGSVREVVRETRLARLGQGVDATGEFHPEALARAFVIVEDYAALIAEHGAQRVRFVATSAARDVSNRQAFEDGIRARLGVAVEVISGDEEARLSAAGVLGGIDAPRPTLIFDIGGGSTELVLVAPDGALAAAVSLDIGAVRVKERFLPGEPPAPAELSRARAHVGSLLDASGVEFARVRAAIGVAGTVTSVAAEQLGLQAYSRAAVHGTTLTRESISATAARWLAMTTDEIVASSPLLQPLRAGVIGAGSLILDEIAARVPGGEVRVSETDILDGIAHQLLTRWVG